METSKSEVGGIQPALKLPFTDDNNNGSVKLFFIYADMPPALITTADLRDCTEVWWFSEFQCVLTQKIITI